MLRNVGSNWIITAVMLVAAYVLTPFTVHTLGDAGYGTWNLINSITGYLALLILGVPMASVRYFAQHVAEGDIKELNRAIGSYTAMYLALGAAAPANRQQSNAANPEALKLRLPPLAMGC